MTVTDKFTKAPEIIPGKTTWKAKDWAIALCNRLMLIGWGIPHIIISDRDSKFLSQFWRQFFETIGVSLLYAAAYHYQTDGASERTNQALEITLRYYFNSMADPTRWDEVLPYLQAQWCSTVSTATGFTPNELKFGFQPTRALDVLNQQLEPVQNFQVRIEAAEAISLSQMAMKRYYDARHTPKSFKVGDEVMLRLHNSYNIPEVANKKLSSQYTGRFKVLERIGKLAYRLDLPPHWRINDVISIAHLEQAHKDPYDRRGDWYPDAVEGIEGDTEDQKLWELSHILDKEVKPRHGKPDEVLYLVRWKGYGKEHDEWLPLSELSNARKLVQDYKDQQRPAQRIGNRLPPRAPEPVPKASPEAQPAQARRSTRLTRAGSRRGRQA